MRTRVYGVIGANHSFHRVSRGVRMGFEALGEFADFVALDAESAGNSAKGATAPRAIMAGPPNRVAAMTSHGQHEQRYVIIAPNSSWLPRKLMDFVSTHATAVAPSSWGASVLEKYTGVYTPPYHHGVGPGFAPMGIGRERVKQAYSNGSFAVLHLSSTERARKGTRQLIAAWKRAVRRNVLGDEPLLHIVVNAPQGHYSEIGGDPTIAVMYGARNLPEAEMSRFYQAYHALCQPSLGEGFGLVPLEARASGVPVIATACTGHADHIRVGEPGVVIVEHGPEALIDDDPDGTSSYAPSVGVGEIEVALERCYASWCEIENEALRAANEVRRRWSWASVTADWLKELERGSEMVCG